VEELKSQQEGTAKALESLRSSHHDSVSALGEEVETLRGEVRQQAGGLQELQQQGSDQASSLKELQQQSSDQASSLGELQRQRGSEQGSSGGEDVRGRDADVQEWRKDHEASLDSLRSQHVILAETLQEQLRSGMELRTQVKKTAGEVQELLAQEAGTASAEVGTLAEALKAELHGEIQELRCQQGQQGAEISELRGQQRQQGAEMSELRGKQKDTLEALQKLEGTHGSFMELCHSELQELRGDSRRVAEDLKALQSLEDTHQSFMEASHRNFEELRGDSHRVAEDVRALQAQGHLVEATQSQLTNDLAAMLNQRSQDGSKAEAFHSLQGVEIASLKVQGTRVESIQQQLQEELKELKIRSCGSQESNEVGTARQSKMEGELESVRTYCQEELTKLRNVQATAGEVMQGLQSKHSGFIEAMEGRYKRDILDLQQGQFKLIEAVQKRVSTDVGLLRTLRQGVCGAPTAAAGQPPQSPLVKGFTSFAT